ncbi:MAG: thioredoxin [Planctomycetota bacterium]|nr:thioredoxin [Planctomycetota bacterium]
MKTPVLILVIALFVFSIAVAVIYFATDNDSSGGPSPSKVLHLAPSEFESKVLAAEGVVLVDFYADWCKPCEMLAPTITELQKMYSSSPDVAIYKLDTDKARSIAMEYGIRNIPCVIVFKNGSETERLVGVRPEQDYRQAIENAR